MNTLLERLAGRKKIIDKRLSNLSEAVNVISELPQDTKISFSFGNGFSERYSDNASKYEVIEYLEEKFKECKGFTNWIGYQVFEGRGKRKGVLSISEHRIKAVLGGTTYLAGTSNTARAAFTISTNLGQR